MSLNDIPPLFISAALIKQTLAERRLGKGVYNRYISFREIPALSSSAAASAACTVPLIPPDIAIYIMSNEAFSSSVLKAFKIMPIAYHRGFDLCTRAHCGIVSLTVKFAVFFNLGAVSRRCERNNIKPVFFFIKPIGRLADVSVNIFVTIIPPEKKGSKCYYCNNKPLRLYYQPNRFFKLLSFKTAV